MAIEDQNRFLTCCVHLFCWPPHMLRGDPPALHRQEEAIEKIHRFCHEIYQVPITWLCAWGALRRYGERLAQFHRDHGDEVAIMEGGVLTRSMLGGEVEEYQGWVEECGLTRPDDYASKEPELVGSQGFQDMTREQQELALSHLKGCFDQAVGQNTRALASPHTNGDTIGAMKAVGLDVLWGYCWNYFCEGINNKGCLAHPFYASEENRNAPEQTPGPQSVLGIHWGPFSPVIGYSVETHARGGQPGYCLNPLELANRSEGHDKFRFHVNVITEWLEQARWNRFTLLPLQLEAVWFDEGEEISPEWYDQYPRFNSLNTEVFYTQIETALRLGAQPMTLSGFADWHRASVGDTAEMVLHSVDHLPNLRSKGKDQAYQPMVLLGNKQRQYWFLKSRGFNYIRRYRYVTVAGPAEASEEYPFDDEPRVYLQVRRSVNMNAGLVLTPEQASYELSGFDLTAYHEDPDYAAVLWEANLPPYVEDSDLEISGAITGLRTLREKNLAILFADLKRGLNAMVLRSDLPGRYVRLERAEKVGRRFELWIRNEADPVELHTLRAVLEPGLRIGGFWWDGFYSHTLFRYGWGSYDRTSGGLELRCFYPVTLQVNHGLTRVSIELL